MRLKSLIIPGMIAAAVAVTAGVGMQGKVNAEKDYSAYAIKEADAELPTEVSAAESVQAEPTKTPIVTAVPKADSSEQVIVTSSENFDSLQMQLAPIKTLLTNINIRPGTAGSSLRCVSAAADMYALANSTDLRNQPEARVRTAVSAIVKEMVQNGSGIEGVWPDAKSFGDTIRDNPDDVYGLLQDSGSYDTVKDLIGNSEAGEDWTVLENQMDEALNG